MIFLQIIDDPRIRGWIFRFIREVKADIFTTYEIEDRFIVANLIIQSLKKVQKSMFFCLGDPGDVQEFFSYRLNDSDPLYELLFSFQKIINFWIHKIIDYENMNLSEMLSDAKNLLQFANNFVSCFLGDRGLTESNKFPEHF